MRPPRLASWLVGRVLPRGTEGDTIRGDLLEDLAARDHERLSSADGVAFQRFPMPMMLTVDPPNHTRLRRLVARDFTPRAITWWWIGMVGGSG